MLHNTCHGRKIPRLAELLLLVAFVCPSILPDKRLVHSKVRVSVDVCLFCHCSRREIFSTDAGQLSDRL